MKRAVLLAAVAIALSACGRVPSTPVTTATEPTPSGHAGTATPVASGSATLVTPQPGGTTTPRPTPTHHRTGSTTTVTEADAGSTVELRVGDTLEIKLPPEYTTPSAHPDGVVVLTSSTGGYPSSEPLHAFFRAHAAGRADVDSITDYACRHATPECMIAQRLWTVHVVVTA